MGRFPSCKSPGKQPIKKRGVKRFLNCGIQSSRRMKAEVVVVALLVVLSNSGTPKLAQK